MSPTPSEPVPTPLYKQLQPRWSGLDRDGVAKHQRLRLIGAMVEVAGSETGYAGANIKLLSTLAGVSRGTFYERFGTTEACFLAAYEYVVARAATHVSEAFRSEQDWKLQLRAAFDAYAHEVVSEPRAARLALVEVLGAGPAALAARERGRRLFERKVASTVRETPGGIELPPLVTKAIVGGVERITRLSLLNDCVEQLPAQADELLAWALSYNSPRAVELSRLAPGHESSRARPDRSRDERARVLRAAAQLAASSGYAQLTRSQILEHAEVREEVFDALFESAEECFLEALDMLCTEALADAARASMGATSRVAAVHRGMQALLDRLAADRVLQRVAFVEVFAVGPAGIRRRERILGQFIQLLLSALPEAQRPNEVVAQAIAGGVWSILHQQVTRGGGRLLRSLAAPLTYIALAPVVGAQATAEKILVLVEDREQPNV